MNGRVSFHFQRIANQPRRIELCTVRGGGVPTWIFISLTWPRLRLGPFVLVRLAPDLGTPVIGRGERKMGPGRQSTSEAIHLPVCQLDKAGIAGPYPSAI
jgi:hypothetical protein